MSEPAPSSALARMLRPARAAPPGSLSEARAWSLSLPRISERQVGLVAVVDGHETGVTDLPSVLSGWDETALSLSLAGPGGDRGIAVISPEVLAALIEVQTIGRVTSRALEPRNPTPVDAALAGHVLDAWIAGVTRARSGPQAEPWTHTRRIPDARTAKLALEDGVFTTETVALSLGNGARTGWLRIILPEGAAAARAADRSGARGPGVVLAVEAEVEAILTRFDVPLQWFRTAGPDTLIPISPAALGQVRLETDEGKLITRARLGRLGDRKAVRMGGDPGGDVTATAPRAGRMALPGMAGPGAGDPPGTGEVPGLPDLPDLPDVPEPMAPMAMADLPDLPG